MVVRRLLILLVLAIGWGYWIGRFTGRGKNDNGRVFVWLGVAGFCGWPLLLQSLVYLGLPLRFTAWPAFAIGVAGLVLAVIAGRRTLVEWLSRGRVYGLVFTTSFLAQASGLLSIGPMQYFGTGHVDHANYVVTAEFLRSEKFATRFEDLGHRPWLLKPLDTKEQRITQCVVLGALAEIDRSSAQECYGTVSAFFVALMALATTAWLRTGGLAAGLAGWAGLGAALTPAITRIQLDGFFSQTATLFVYPALAGLLTWSAPLTTATKVCAALLLAFMIGSYSEVAVLGVALVAALVLFRGPPVRSRVFEFAAIVAGALFLNAGYLGRLVNFLIGQALFASNPRVLAALFPESGTWIGWGRMFVDLRWPDLVVGTGAGVSFLAVRGVVATGPVQRRERLMVVGIALLPLLVLRLMPDFPRYPFGKLAAHFVPIWLGASMYGLTSFGKASVGFRRFAWCCGCFGAAASFVSAWPFQIEIVRPVGRLKALSSDALLQSRRDAEAHPERAYLVAHRDPLMALWLCYLGRANPIVLEVRTLGDRIVPSESSAFRHWTKELGELSWLDPELSGAVQNYEPPPTLTVRGASSSGRSEFGESFLMSKSAEFVFTRPSGGNARRLVYFDFVASPGGSNGAVLLSFEGPSGDVQKFTLRYAGWTRWRVALPAGETRYRLNATVVDGSPGGSAEVVLKLLSVEVALEILPEDPRPSAGPAELQTW